MVLEDIRTRLSTALNGIAQGTDIEYVKLEIGFAMGMLDELIRQEGPSSARQLGHLGGSVTAQRGPDYFRQLAARRKTHGGGRPRKDAE
jgi:hypothetical protein